MKKKKAYILILGILILGIVGLGVHLKNASCSTVNSKVSKLSAVQITHNGITVSIDPRIELLASVQLVSNYDSKFKELTKEQFSYKDKMKKHFLGFSDHKVVKHFDAMSSEGYSYDAPPTAMLYFTNPPKMEKQLNFEEQIVKRAGGEKELTIFMNELNQYAEETRFNTFYQENQELYKTMLDKAVKSMGNANYVEEMESYYRMKNHSYNIILSPIFHSGGFGPRVKAKEGSYDVYSIQGPQSTEGDIPSFGDEASFQYLAWHEFGHSFVNPTTHENIEEVKQYESLYAPIAEVMQKQAYGNWETCVNEHIVRAVTTRLSYNILGKVAGDEALAYEKSRGFFYIEALCKKLEEYEKDKDKFKSFKEFYPELVKVFKELSEKKLDKDFYTPSFNSPINAAFQSKLPTVIITPTNEEDSKAQEDITKYVENIKAMIEKKESKCDIVTDKEALKMDLRGEAMLAYGTVEGNLFLKKYAAALPFKIDKDKIVADQNYEGNDLRLITTLPNPENHKNPLLIYTAQQAKDVVNINEVLHGPKDYVIAKGKKNLKEGMYVKDNEVWTFK